MSGRGSIYRRGTVWWVAYYVHGKQIRESSRSTRRGDATALLARRMGALAEGRVPAYRAERVRLDALLDDVRNDYRVNGRRSLDRVEIAVGHLRRFFGGARAMAINGATVNQYVAHRQRAGVSNATINRESAALQRAFTLGMKHGLVVSRPHIPTLAERNVRTGFFEPEQLAAVLRHLPEEVRPVVEFGAITGWRLREVLTLTWRQVDVVAGAVRLEPGTTKNGKGRMFPFTPELRALLEVQRAATEDLQRRTGRIVPWVFWRGRGEPIRSFRRAWRHATRAAGCPGRLFHDLRRTAVRTFERAGIPRSVAMQLTGHETEAVYRRYAIVAEGDLRVRVTTIFDGLAVAHFDGRVMRVA